VLSKVDKKCPSSKDADFDVDVDEGADVCCKYEFGVDE